MLHAYGRIGTLGWASNAWFNIENASFFSWVNGFWVDLLGVELFGMVFVDGLETEYSAGLINPTTGLNVGNMKYAGVGWTFGMSGQVRSTIVSVEAAFGTPSDLFILSPTPWQLGYPHWLRYASLRHQEFLGTDSNPFRLERVRSASRRFRGSASRLRFTIVWGRRHSALTRKKVLIGGRSHCLPTYRGIWARASA